MYILYIRIGTEYVPVNYTNGKLDYENPTVFTQSTREEAEKELCTYLKPNDYKFLYKLDLL